MSPLEKELIKEIAARASDPLAFVIFAFPWGVPGTELEHEDGPDDWQRSVLADVRDGLNPNEAIRQAVASGHGIGKLHGYEMRIDTPSGERRWGDLMPGDLVFGADGVPTRILQCHPFTQVPAYRVSFDDGSSCDVSSGHLWNVRGRRERRNNLETWRTLETIDILEMGVTRSNGVAQARQWEIPIQGAAQFDEREIDIHPYLMGVWLGDGSKSEPVYTKPHAEIAAKIRSFGYSITTYGDGKTNRIQNVSHLFRGGVFDCGSHDRYIPSDYKFNTVANRRALLEGLCDTDGEVHASGSIGYSTTSRRLADDVIWLARSLGCKAMMQATPKQGWYPDGDGGRVECRDCYRITINAPFNPFTIQHRKATYKPSEPRYLKRWIESIEAIEPMDGQCITVEAADGLYLANDFIVTHNSALVAWLILWAISTETDTRGVVTANTESQLRTKTWPELAKWYRRLICRHWFQFDATAIYAKDPEHTKTWRIDMVPWSERNTEAFAGLHNQGRRILVIYDEASSIPDIIWETTEGALTDKDTEILWFVFGNPTRNTGRFRECFGRFRHIWKTRQIDSRSTRITNKDQIAQWVKDYGEDSDFVRVRVRGVFPRAGSMQFIPSDLVEAAMSPDRHYDVTLYDPAIIGVDVARFGDDQTIIRLRRGRDARSVAPVKMRGADTMAVAAKVVELADYWAADAIFVDGGGVGGGVVDRLRMLRQPVYEVQFGAKADRSMPTQEGMVVYANKRAEMYGTMRDWLRGGMIDEDPELLQDLTGVEYGYVMRDGRDAIQLEKKEDMKKRGLASPDNGDALAITFAYPVQKSPHEDRLGFGSTPRHQTAYNPMADLWKRR